MNTQHLHHYFTTIISDLHHRAEDFRTDLDVLDDELLELFHQEMDRVIAKLNVGIHKQHEEAVREGAHTLLGIGGVAGSPEISVVGEELTQAVKNHNWGRCQVLLIALERWKEDPKHSSALSNKPFVAKCSLEGLVLVVDDELPNRQYLNKLLKECGADTLMAENGEMALEMIRKFRPDLVLIDVIMPGMNGYEVCEKITTSPHLSQTSVIMVTAKSSAEDVEKAFAMGAFDYIRKPYQSRELLARVTNALKLKRNKDALELWKAKMSREMEMAGWVQSKLFDTTPVFGAYYDYHVCYQPSHHIGGDMFDLIQLPNGKLLAYIGDVAGHGVGSALISTLMKGMVQDIVAGMDDISLAEIGNELHTRFRSSVKDPEIYTTLILLMVDPKSRCCHCLSCGHHLPLVFDEGGTLQKNLYPDIGGMPIGLSPFDNGDTYFKEDVIEFTIPASGLLYLYTDGLTEALNKEDEECGLKGLLKAIDDYHAESTQFNHPQGILDCLLAKGFNLSADDCTIVSLKMVSEPTLLVTGSCLPTVEALTEMAYTVAHLLTPQGWEETSISLLRLLIVEYAVNVITHGNPSQDSQLFYRLSLDSDSVMLVLKDQGVSWDPIQSKRSQEHGPQEPLNEHGRGLNLIESISDKQEYYRYNQTNCFVYHVHKDIGNTFKEP